MLDFMRRKAGSAAVKITFGIIIVVFVFWGVGSFNNNETSGGVLVTVGGKPLLIKDFQKRLTESQRLMKRQNPGITDEMLDKGGFKWQVYDEMVLLELVQQEAQRLGVSVSKEEMVREIARVPAFQDENGKFDLEGRYNKILEANGIAPAEFEDDFRQNLLLEKMVSYMGLPAYTSLTEARSIYLYAKEQAKVDYLLFSSADFKPWVSLTDEQIKTWYETNKERLRVPDQIAVAYVDISPKALSKPDAVSDAEAEANYKANQDRYSHPQMVNARHILIPMQKDAPADAVKAAETKLNDFARQIRKGTDASKLAPKELSPTGGPVFQELGWFARGAMVKEFEDAVFLMKKGEVSAPVRSDFGLHLIMLDDVKEAGASPFAEVKKEIKRELAEERAATEVTTITDKLLDAVGGGVDLAKAAQDFKLELKKTDLFAKDEAPDDLSLTPEALDALFKMGVGAATDTPMATQDGFMLAKIVEVKPSYIPDLAELRAKVIETMTAQEALKMAEERAKSAVSMLEGADGEKKFLSQYGKLIKTSRPFSRQGFVPDLGSSPALAQAVFEAKNNDWFKASFAVTGGYLLAKPAGRIAPTDTEWEAEKDRVLSGLTQSKVGELFNSYMEALKLTAKISNPRTDVLGPKPGVQLGQ